MRHDPIDFCLALGLHFFKEGRQDVGVQPSGSLREGRHWGQLRGCGSRRTVPEQARFLQMNVTVCRQFQRIEPFVDHAAQAIHYPRSVEVQARWGMVLQRGETGACAKDLLRLGEGMRPQGFEERVAGGHPFETVCVSHVAVCGQARVACRE
jgi:hypothetical protein